MHMELISQHLGLYLIIWQIGSKGQKSVMITVVGENYFTQGSILGPLLFSILICDLLADGLEMANYADDTTPYVCGKDITSVIKSLEKAAGIVFTWFKNNQMKGNEDKCHVVLSTHEDMHVKIGTSHI